MSKNGRPLSSSLASTRTGIGTTGSTKKAAAVAAVPRLHGFPTQKTRTRPVTASKASVGPKNTIC